MSANNFTDDIEFFMRSKKDENLPLYIASESSKILTEKCVISNDIVLYKNKMDFTQDIQMQEESKMKALCLGLTLNGNIKYIDKNKNETIHKKQNSTFLKYINSENATLEAKKDDRVDEIGVVIKGEFLDKFFLQKLHDFEKIHKDYEKNISTTLKLGKISPKIIHLIRDIYNSPFNDDLHSIYMQSKVYEIIYHEFFDFFSTYQDEKYEKVKFSKDDIEALKKAKNLIEQGSILKLSQISKQVALNEFKLKYGFKKFFHISPGAMMLDFRLQKAKNLLHSSELSVTEISTLIGYKYVQSFSNAFRKKFNQNPTDVLKSRKYYI